MFRIGKLAFIYGVAALGIFGPLTRSVFASFVKPAVHLSPTCRPTEPGFNILINTNGFSPNGSVGWKFVGSDSKIPLYASEANSTGGFNDVTFADDLKPDDYKMHFADDVNSSDGKVDIGAARVYAKATVPCKQ
jgi:hypothetical protein